MRNQKAVQCFWIVAVALLTVGSEAHARFYKPLNKFVETETKTMMKALQEVEASDPMDLDGKFALKRFFLRLQAKIGFSAEVVSIDLIPEVELIWQKEKTSNTM
jgi:hypothetical protein